MIKNESCTESITRNLFNDYSNSLIFYLNVKVYVMYMYVHNVYTHTYNVYVYAYMWAGKEQ